MLRHCQAVIGNGQLIVDTNKSALVTTITEKEIDHKDF